MRALAICALLPLAAAGAADSNFDKIASRVARNQALLPNYICSQTVERWSRGLTCGICESVERMRLEVSSIGGEEMFSWPGGGAFEERGLFEMIGGQGMALAGDYTTIAGGVFVANDAAVVAAPETTYHGRRSLRYSYQIRGRRAGWRITIDGREAVLRYRGEFWADAETFQLQRFEAEVLEIPEGLKLQSARVAIEYERPRIGESEFTLPAAVESELVRTDGLRHKNRTVYTGCRQYGASSSVSFGETEAAPEVGASQKAPATPEGLVVLTTLATPIDLAQGAVGDEVTLIAAGQARRGGFTVPAGAVIRGRIVGMTMNLTPDREVTLQMRTTSLERNGRQIPFHARLTGAKSRERLSGTRDWLEFHRPAGGEPVLRFDAEGREAFPQGVQLTWRTVGR